MLNQKLEPEAMKPEVSAGSSSQGKEPPVDDASVVVA